jgi:hypothetical protein
MPISNIYSSWMWATSGSQYDISTTIARAGGRGWAFAETSLSRVSGSGAAYAWISGYRYQPSPDQILNAISPNPDGAVSSQWISNCLSATFTLRVNNDYAYAIAKLSPWD